MYVYIQEYVQCSELYIRLSVLLLCTLVTLAQLHFSCVSGVLPIALTSQKMHAVRAEVRRPGGWLEQMPDKCSLSIYLIFLSLSLTLSHSHSHQKLGK